MLNKISYVFFALQGVVSRLSDSDDEEFAADKPGSSVAQEFLRPAAKQAPNYSNFANKMMVSYS